MPTWLRIASGVWPIGRDGAIRPEAPRRINKTIVLAIPWYWVPGNKVRTNLGRFPSHTLVLINTFVQWIRPLSSGLIEWQRVEIRRSCRGCESPMRQGGRVDEKVETQSIMKICIGAEPKQILAAVILGTGDDEVKPVPREATYAKAPHAAVQGAMNIHPAVSEFLPTILAKLRPFI